MNKMFLLCAVAGFSCVSLGCDSASESTGSAFGMQAGVPAQGASSSESVARTVHEFLTAIRTGDTRASSSRLTPLALQMINENDMTFAPPASENATFQVGQVEMYGADRASAESIWSDLDADGQRNEEKMTWALKLDQGQWRISGLIAYVGENQSPVKINFENPSEFMGGSPQPKTAQPPQQQQQQGYPSPRQASQPTRDPFR